MMRPDARNPKELLGFFDIDIDEIWRIILWIVAADMTLVLRGIFESIHMYICICFAFHF